MTEFSQPRYIENPNRYNDPAYTGLQPDSFSDEAMEQFYQDQKALREEPKPFSMQFNDAYFADLDAKNVEYIKDAFEEFFSYTMDSYMQIMYDLDSPAYFPEQLQPQLAVFDALDEEQQVYLNAEPKTFDFPTISFGLLRDLCRSFRASKQDTEPLWLHISDDQLISYFHSRKQSIQKAGSARLDQIRGTKS